MLLSLCMIVKNEALAIGRTLASVRGVCDRWDILDTGSTDGTEEVVRNYLATEEGPTVGGTFRSLRGQLVSGPFVDFADARNRVLDLAHEAGARWSLSLSADEILVEGDRLRAFLERYDGPEGALLVELRTETDVSRFPRLVRTDSSYRYEGVVHERPVDRVNRKDPTVVVPGVVVEHHATDPARRLQRLREFDIPALEREVEAGGDGTRRALLLLGQTHEQIAAAVGRALGGPWVSHIAAALGYYMRRIEAGMAADGPADLDAEWATINFLNMAGLLGIYGAEEMVRRLGALEKTAFPQVHFLIASNLARLDARAGLDRAKAAARMARDALANPGRYSVNRSIVWSCHLIAAHCARALDEPAGARASALAGIETGGPKEAFAEFLTGGRPS